MSPGRPAGATRHLTVDSCTASPRSQRHLWARHPGGRPAAAHHPGAQYSGGWHPGCLGCQRSWARHPGVHYPVARHPGGRPGQPLVTRLRARPQSQLSCPETSSAVAVAGPRLDGGAEGQQGRSRSSDGGLAQHRRRRLVLKAINRSWPTSTSVTAANTSARSVHVYSAPHHFSLLEVRPIIATLIGPGWAGLGPSDPFIWCGSGRQYRIEVGTCY